MANYSYENSYSLHKDARAKHTVHKLLVHFIQTVYGPSWFNIKREKSFVEAPHLIYKMVQAAKSAKAGDDGDGRVSSVLESVLQRSAFCCLPEIFLAALLFSEDKDHQEAAVKRILDIRRRPVKPPVSTAIPRLNFNAEEWGELIDISVALYEPLCTRNISDEDLEAMVLVKTPL